MKNTKRDIETYKQKIKKSGFRLTGTRMIILDILLKSSNELNAEELFFLSRKKQPGIGLATIYRTLKLLEKEGLIIRAGYEDDKAKYTIKDNKDPDLKNSAFKPKQYGSGKNKIKIDAKNRPKADIDYQSGIINKSTLDSFEDMKRINTIQNQLSQWLGELNKIKREKELALEDVIKDFGKVDKIVSYHENQRSNLIQILLDVQNEYRWLPKHILLYISNRLDIPLTDIYGIATFYKYFNLEPQGKHSIIACMGTACHVRGAMNLLQRITGILGIKPGDTTGDYKFTLKTVNCLGCCALGPVIMISNKYYSNPSIGNLKKILKQLN